MPVTGTYTPTEHTANGSTTDFTYSFRIINSDELKVYFDGVEQSSGFTVSGVGNSSGTVAFDTPPANGTIVRFERDVPRTRDIDYVEGGGVASDTLDDDFDRIVMMVQQVENRSLLTSAGEDNWDAGNNRITNVADPTGDSDVATRGWALSTGGSFVSDAQAARDAAQSAQSAAETARDTTQGYRDTTEGYRDDADAAQTAAENAQAYAEEWANKAEDSLISTAAGGNGSSEYSSRHWAAKASASASAASTSESNAGDSETNAATSESNASDSATYAEEWANKAEDSLVSTAAGGNGADDYSARHWAAKASADASSAEASLTSFQDVYSYQPGEPSSPQDGHLWWDTDDNVLKIYDGAAWQTYTTPTNLNNLDDVSITTPANGSVLTYNSGTGEWEDAAVDISGETLSTLSDVSSTAPSDGDYLGWNNGNSEWEPVTPPTIPTDTSDLSDVASSSPSDRDIFQFNSSSGDWEPTTTNYAFRAVKDTAQNNISQNTRTTITFGDEEFDEGGVYDGTDTFTAPVDGIYHFDALLLISSVDSGNRFVQTELLVNGTDTIPLQRDFNSSGISTSLVVGGGVTLKLNQNDTVVVQVFTNSPNNADANSSTSHFSGHLVKAH